ncbi:MAG: glycosyltransferase, partial [Synergistaceae bacterium]|nr:glycosyltransferase [Synergistaceae bacterium]
MSLQSENDVSSNVSSVEDRRKYRLALLLRDLGEGGAERSALRLANGLARNGHDVVLLLFKKKGPLLEDVALGVEVVDLKDSFFKLLAYLHTFRVDFLLPVYTAMRALLARLVLRIPFHVVLSQRNMFTLDRGPLQTRLRFVRCRLLYPIASACVCISRGVAEEMRDLGLIEPEKIRVIYNPVVTNKLSVQMEAPLDHPWFKAFGPTVVLSVGRLGGQKDFATLIRAFALLVPRHP